MRVEHGSNSRLFVAVPLPRSLVCLAVSAQQALACEKGVRPVRLEQLHCTLAFIGEADERGMQAARKAVIAQRDEKGGDVRLDGLMFLPNAKRARVLALGLDDQDGVLLRLRESVTSMLIESGVMSSEARPFRAHVTIARIKGRGSMQPMADCEPVTFGVESVCLYRSELRREGAVYSVLERADLQRAGG